MKETLKKDVVRDLQNRILAMQRSIKPSNERFIMGLGPIEVAFPEGNFPIGAVHEFVSHEVESAAATSGFLTCLLNKMMKRKGFCLWISSRRQVFPPALKLMGVDPEMIVFVDLPSDKDVLWAVEEALRCEALVAVVGELRELTFAQSRRLQLAIEQSGVTGFIHRVQPQVESTTACVARWKITQLPSIVEAGMPGIGFPSWNVELTKVRNGRPGSWKIDWTPSGFQQVSQTAQRDEQTGTTRYA